MSARNSDQKVYVYVVFLPRFFLLAYILVTTVQPLRHPEVACMPSKSFHQQIFELLLMLRAALITPVPATHSRGALAMAVAVGTSQKSSDRRRSQRINQEPRKGGF